MQRRPSRWGTAATAPGRGRTRKEERGRRASPIPRSGAQFGQRLGPFAGIAFCPGWVRHGLDVVLGRLSCRTPSLLGGERNQERRVVVRVVEQAWVRAPLRVVRCGPVRVVRTRQSAVGARCGSEERGGVVSLRREGI